MCVEIQVSASQPVICWVYFYLKCFKVRGFKKKKKQGLLHWIDERIHVQRNNQARTKDTGQLSRKMDAGRIHYFCACFTVSIKCVSAYKHSKITSCIELTENFNKNEKKPPKRPHVGASTTGAHVCDCGSNPCTLSVHAPWTRKSVKSHFNICVSMCMCACLAVTCIGV